MALPPKMITMSGGGATGRLNFLQAAVLDADRTLQMPIRARDLLTTVQGLLVET